MKALVLVPAYNESARIARVLAGIRAAVPQAALLVVDDGSADDTAAVARAAGARVVRLPFNLGAGVAAQTGYKLAVREGYDCVVQLDADVLITLRRAGFRLRDVPVRMYARAGGRSMHAGLRPVYYVFKMLLSVALAPVRREAIERKGS